jgi:hypothetical protein
MSTSSTFDKPQAHRFFSADCFNRAWELMDKADRSAEEDELMISACLASLWHWSQREDCSARNLSIGYWQASRVYALLGRAENAARYAEICLRHSAGQPPFLLGYAHESLARAALLRGDKRALLEHLAEARRLLESVHDAEDRALLQKDLDSLASQAASLT